MVGRLRTKRLTRDPELTTYNVHDETYLALLELVLNHGESRPDRTGVGTHSLFGASMGFKLGTSFPLLTTKKLHWKSILHELLWMLHGETNVRYLNDNGVTIWDEWADANGELGPVYGAQWRTWKGPVKQVVPVKLENVGWNSYVEHEYIDQLAELCERLQRDPYSRRHVISAWNVADVADMALPPCHALFQFYVSARTNALSCQLYQRSADVFLGVPFNVASYALLTCIIADKLGFERGEFRWVGGDVHLYDNHREQALEQLNRDTFPAPYLEKLERGDPLATRVDEIRLQNYLAQPTIRAPIAV